MTTQPLHITVLTGGIGGSKLIDGLARLDTPVSLTIIGNTGDDIERHGLWVSPDLDIVTYTLAGLVDPDKGWGFRGDTFATLTALGRLGEETWMNLGDRDLATHIQRTRWRREGVRPTDIARRIAQSLGVATPILPATDDYLQTIVKTPDGEMNFQEFFLRAQCRPDILDVRYAGSESARATPEALAAINHADCLVIAPSNPIASIGPILAVNGIRQALQSAQGYRVAVSPLVGGHSLKGPSDRMMTARGFASQAAGVADYYKDMIDALVIDEIDRALASDIEGRGVTVHVASTVMRTPDDKRALAQDILRFVSAQRAHP